MNFGTLLLIPVPLAPVDPAEADRALADVLPAPVRQRAAGLRHFVAENAKSARAFLKALPCAIPVQQIKITELNEHTPADALAALLAPLLAGHDVGLLSEAGCPAVADPGADLVAAAHRHGIRVEPLTGPSSILLALMASGLGGQNFAFHGYLPAKEEARRKCLIDLERESRRERRTQLFIETPYRNRHLLASVLATCAADTRLCVATDLTLPTESIVSLRIAEWQKKPPVDIDRRPSVFLLRA